MLTFKPGVDYRWLHKGDDSICLELDSDEYSEKLSGGWSDKRGEPELVMLGALPEEEIRELAKEAGINNYWNAQIDNLIEKLREVE